MPVTAQVILPGGATVGRSIVAQQIIYPELHRSKHSRSKKQNLDMRCVYEAPFDEWIYEVLLLINDDESSKFYWKNWLG